MSRPALFLLLLAAVAAAGDSVAYVDGKTDADARLIRADADQAEVALPGGTRQLPTVHLVAATFTPTGTAEEAGSFNLYLAGGDRVRGTVRGGGESVALESPAVTGLVVPLTRVRAVRFGRLVGEVQAVYERVFAQQLERPRDVVVVQQEAKPFLLLARVLAVGEKSLTVRIAGGTEQRQLAAHKVYGFVRVGDPPPAAGRLNVRLRLADGGRLTLPLESIEPEVVSSGATRVKRDGVERIEFRGDHIAHLSDFEPLDVREVALFGKAPRWRRDEMVLGGPLQLGNRTYRRGIGVHAHSRLEFVLGGRWSSFFVICGIDDAAGSEGEATFRILGDGKLLKEFTRRRGEPLPVTLDVKGVDRLVLEAAAGETYTSDFCDWAEARVFNAKRG